MFRRLTRNGKFIYVGIVVQEKEQKREESDKSVQYVKTDEGGALDSLKRFMNLKITRFENIFKKRDSDEGISQRYRLITENVQSHYSGWDRLVDFISVSEHQEVNPSLAFVFNSAQIGVFLGFLFGGLREYAKAFNLFMLTNDTTKFMNASEANTKLARVGTQAFFKGALLTAPKVGFLVGTFTFVQLAVAEYRGKNGILEFPIAGAVTTAVMKWNLGIRGMISGCCSGALTGLLLGPVINLILRLNGLTISDTKCMLHEIKKRKEELLRESSRLAKNTSTDLEKFYDEKTKHLPPGFSDDE